MTLLLIFMTSHFMDVETHLAKINYNYYEIKLKIG